MFSWQWSKDVNHTYAYHNEVKLKSLYELTSKTLHKKTLKVNKLKTNSSFLFVRGERARLTGPVS